VLRQFSSHYRPGVPGLEAAVAAGRWEEAQQALHALRGACGAVGAGALVEQAQALENKLQALADGVADADESTGLLQATAVLLAELGALVAAIAERLRLAGGTVGTSMPAARGAPAGPAPGADATALDATGEAALDGLAALLAAADFQSGARYREIEPLLRQAFGDGGVRSIERPLRRHDYEAALAALQVLRQQRVSPARPTDQPAEKPDEIPADRPLDQ
jgi:HPt (histidine-containing phosphotransfer) domain-containing protein